MIMIHDVSLLFLNTCRITNVDEDSFIKLLVAYSQKLYKGYDR